MKARPVSNTSSTCIPEPFITRFLFADIRMAPIWFLIRVAVGMTWLTFGMAKLGRAEWTGARAGEAVDLFVREALNRAGGPYPDVSTWYASFLQSTVLHHTAFFAYLVTFGEIFVGVGLVLGILTGVSAFCGGLLNTSFLFAGAVSFNPFLFILSTWLVLGWRVAGEIGLDHWLLPRLGVPGIPGHWRRRWTRRETAHA